MAGPEFTPAELAEARSALSLPATATQRTVEAAIALELGLCDRLISDIEIVLADEASYLQFCGELGWELDE